MNDTLQELIAPNKPEAFSEEQLGLLAETVNRLLAKQLEIATVEEELKALKAQERVINQGEVPELMENLGFETITLKDGRKISVKDSPQITIPAASKPQTLAWLVKNGHGDLIKMAVTAAFARGESKMAKQVEAHLIKMGVSCKLAESVHAGTLKAWAREELAAGHTFPAGLFKIHVVKVTTVK